jgi:hypothetical protein
MLLTLRGLNEAMMSCQYQPKRLGIATLEPALPTSRLPPAPLRVNASLRLAELGVDVEPLRQRLRRRAAAPCRAAYMMCLGAT